jgi:hypothetical protein
MNPPRLTKLALTWKRDIQSEPTRELNNQKNHMFWAISQPLAFVCYTNDLFFCQANHHSYVDKYYLYNWYASMQAA